jgi:hypothetical protein
MGEANGQLGGGGGETKGRRLMEVVGYSNGKPA